MKRLESNVTSNTATDRITRLKNKALGIDTSCNIIKNTDYKLTYKSKARDLRSFKNTNQNKVASEQIKEQKSKCIDESKLKKLVDCSNIVYEDAKYKIQKPSTLRTFTNNKQEKFSSDKTKELRNVVTDVSNNCNLIKPKQENLTYKHVLKTSKRAYENVKSMFSYSDRNKALANKCNVVKVAPMGSTVGVIKNLTDCSDAVVEQETVAAVKKSYAHNKYESAFPDLNSGERTDTLKQKVKFENLRDDTTAYYVDENLEGLKYQVTKVAPNSNGVGVSVVNAESYSELYDLAKGFSLCSKDTTDCFINRFLSTDPRESWVQEYTEIDYSNYTTVTDISADGTRFVNKLNEPNAGKSILKTISQSTKASGLSDTRRNYNISYSAGVKTDPNYKIFSVEVNSTGISFIN